MWVYKHFVLKYCHIIVCEYILDCSIYYLFALCYLVPEDSPTDVMVQPFSVSSVLISWESPLIPNGHITQYSAYVNFSNGSQLAVIPIIGNQTQLEIVGLSSYQLVLVQIAARTAVGEGPRSTLAEGRSSEEGEKKI